VGDRHLKFHESRDNLIWTGHGVLAHNLVKIAAITG
jgi:hypothetical protein